MDFKQYLIEKSFTEKDLPKDFWIVFDIGRMMDELKTGKIKGLKGISSSNEIMFSFLGVARDAMFQIDAKQLISLNKITRILYDNPHYLVSKNMWALRRIFSASPSGWINQVFGNLFDRLQVETKRSKHKELSYDMGYYGFRNVDYDWAKKVKTKINNLKDLSSLVHKYIHYVFTEKTNRKYDISVKEISDMLYVSILKIGELYSSENEWVVKSDILTLPKKTILHILTKDVDKFNKKAYDLVKNNPKMDSMDFFGLFSQNDLGKEHNDISLYKQMIKFDNIKDELGNKYTVKKIDYNFFKRKQKESWK